MNCEKCQSGEMVSTSVRRMSPGLVVIGWIFLSMGLLGLASAGCVALVGTATTGGAAGQTLTEGKERTRAQIEELGVDPTVAGEFERTGRVSDATLAQLDEADRAKVERILSGHAAQTAGAVAGAGLLAGAGAAFVLFVGIISLPTFIVGLLLTLKKKVWRCGGCGYVFERA